MSENKRNDLLPMLVILESLGKIRVYTDGFKTAESFFIAEDQVWFNASLMLLSTIGENSGKISEDLKLKYPKLSWRELRGLRNRIVHDYTGIDYEMVFEIITNDLKYLKDGVANIVKQELASGIFDIEELTAARGSKYYKHVDFESLVNK